MAEESSEAAVEKKVVYPGEILREYENYRAGNGIIKFEGKLYSSMFGILSTSKRSIQVIPYKEIYRPKQGDLVVGVIVGYGNSGWFVDIGSYTKAFLHVSEALKGRFDSRIVELSDHFRIGDVILAKILDTIRLGYFPITIKGKGLGKIGEAFFIRVNPVKLRRIVGRRGSMINLIKKYIDGEIIVAKNGVIIYKGTYDSYIKFKNTIDLISSKTYVSGLTSLVSEILSSKR